MSFSTSANQFFNRLITPSTASIYATFIDALDTGGVWAKIVGLWVFAAPDSGSSLINLKSASFQAFLHILGVKPTFTANSGWNQCGAGTLQSVDLNFNPSTAGGTYTQNDAMLAGWVIGSTIETRPLISDPTVTGAVEIFPRYSAGTTFWSVNTNGTEATYASTDPSGFWVAQRTASNAMALYHNNVQVATSSIASAPLINASLISGLLANTASMVAVGGSLSAGELTTFYTAAQTYMAAV